MMFETSMEFRCSIRSYDVHTEEPTKATVLDGSLKSTPMAVITPDQPDFPERSHRVIEKIDNIVDTARSAGSLNSLPTDRSARSIGSSDQ